MGPVKGIERIPKLLSEFESPYVNGIVLCKGHFTDREVIENCDIPKILHLSNSNQLSMHPDSKILVGSVEQTIALGADAVSVHVNMGSENENIILNP